MQKISRDVKDKFSSKNKQTNKTTQMEILPDTFRKTFYLEMMLLRYC